MLTGFSDEPLEESICCVHANFSECRVRGICCVGIYGVVLGVGSRRSDVSATLSAMGSEFWNVGCDRRGAGIRNLVFVEGVFVID